MTDREKLIELLKAADRYEFEEQKKKGDFSIEAGWNLIADYLIANGVIILPVPIGTMIWEVIDHYDSCDCCAKLDFNQVSYQPFENGDHAVLLNTGKFGYRKRTYFDTLEHATECLKQKVLTGEWDGSLIVSCVNGRYRHERKEEIQRMLSKNVTNWMSLPQPPKGE